MGVREVETTPKLRPCQDAYFDDGNPAVQKDRDADIFNKHSTNAAAHFKSERRSREVIIVDRDVSSSEDEISLVSGVEEIDPNFENFKARVDNHNSATGTLLQAGQRNIGAAPPHRHSPKSKSPVSRDRLYAELPKLPADGQAKHDSATQNAVFAVESKPPPIPEKSRLRSVPKTERLAAIQGTSKDKAPLNNQNNRSVLKSTDEDVTPKIVSFKANISEKANKQSSMSVDQSKALETVRPRRTVLKILSVNMFKNRQSNRSNKTPEELDFEKGKTIIYASIHYARETKAVRESKPMPVQWLHINDDLAADARVTANGEDIRASVGSPAINRKAAAVTRIEVVEATGIVRLIGPAEHGALTLGQMWVGGWDKRHKVDAHGSTIAVQHDDESCPCQLYQVWKIISDESYKYIGVARSAREHKWIVHLAKEMPTRVEGTKTDEKPRPTTTNSRIKRKPIPTREYMEAISRVG